jgi:hypothetical protein
VKEDVMNWLTLKKDSQPLASLNVASLFLAEPEIFGRRAALN